MDDRTTFICCNNRIEIRTDRFKGKILSDALLPELKKFGLIVSDAETKWVVNSCEVMKGVYTIQPGHEVKFLTPEENEKRIMEKCTASR